MDNIKIMEVLLDALQREQERIARAKDSIIEIKMELKELGYLPPQGNKWFYES